MSHENTSLGQSRIILVIFWFTLFETFICGVINLCSGLYPGASNFRVVYLRQGDLTNQFIFRTILAPIQNIFKFPNQVRKTYGPEDGIDLS